MKAAMNKTIILFLVIVTGLVGAWLFLDREPDPRKAPRGAGQVQVFPVEVAPIERGIIALKRTFSGALVSPASLVVAPKVSGRIERLRVQLADRVERGSLVAELDNDEYVQAVAQSRAELAVAVANRAEAESALAIASRELERVTQLRERGVASESNLDTARASQLARRAQLEVARAGVTRAEAALETSRIRLDYTKISADWSGDGTRVVAERFVDEGETVAANAPLLRIVVLDPLTAVIFVAEADYASLRPGLSVILTTDAFVDEVFPGRIARIAPVFQEATRQARVEISVDNPAQRLKPGMFIRATIELKRATDALIVPRQALAERDNRTGVFVVSAEGTSVSWREVRVGIRDQERVQILGEGLSGRVVTLGQQLLKDGAAIIIPADQEQSPKPAAQP
jgi:RND family efflux transporter MFP subunit